MIASILIIGVVVPAALSGPAGMGGPGAHTHPSPRLRGFSLDGDQTAFSAHGDTASDYLADIAFPQAVYSQMNGLYRNLRNVRAVMEAYSRYFSKEEGLKGFAAFFQGREGRGIKALMQDLQDYIQGRGSRLTPMSEVNGLAVCEAAMSAIPVFPSHAEPARRLCLCKKELAVSGAPPSTCGKDRRLPRAPLHAMYDLHELMEYLAAQFKNVAEQIAPSNEYDSIRFINNCLRHLGNLRAEAATYVNQLMNGQLTLQTSRLENNFENQYNVEYTNVYDTHLNRADRTASGMYVFRANRYRNNFNNGHFNDDRLDQSIKQYNFGPFANASTNGTAATNAAMSGFAAALNYNLFNGNDPYATGNYNNKLFKNAGLDNNFDAEHSEFDANNVMWNALFNHHDTNVKPYDFANNFANDFNNNLVYNRNYNTNDRRPIP